jgi:16S rRNA processing protein RimM
MTPSDRVIVGVIRGAHGIKGEVKLTSFTADPAAIKTYKPLETASGAKLEIAKLRPEKDGFIASFTGVVDRNQAEAMRGVELFVARDKLPAPKDDEVYLIDLEGAEVFDRSGAKLGTVIGFENYGAGDLMDVAIPDRKHSLLIPFTKPFLVSADATNKHVVVDLPAGFIDEKDVE